MSTTDRNRRLAWLIFAGVVLIGAAGWVFGLDVAGLTPVLTAATTGALVGEGSNAAKRATFKREAVEP